MKWRSDTAQLIPGKWVSSRYPGHGVLGSVLRVNFGAGENGAAPMFDDWDAGDDNKEFRLLITRWPTNGTLTIDEDSVFSYVGTADYASATLFVDGVEIGPEEIGFFGGSSGTLTSLGGLASTFAIGAPSVYSSEGVALGGVGGLASVFAIGAPTLASRSEMTLIGVGGFAAVFALGVPTLTSSAEASLSTLTELGGLAPRFAIGLVTVQSLTGVTSPTPAGRTYEVPPDSPEIVPVPALGYTYRYAPGARLDFAWDWRLWLQPGETLVDSAVEVSHPAKIESMSRVGSVVTGWLNVPRNTPEGTVCNLTCRITTVNTPTRVDYRTHKLVISSR